MGRRDWTTRSKGLLFGLVGVIGVVVLWIYGVGPLLRRERQLRTERLELDRRIGEVERLLREEATLRSQWSQRHAEALRVFGEWLPPESNPLLWASEFVYRHARRAGVKIESIAEARLEVPEWARARERSEEAGDGTSAARPRRPSAPPKKFIPYAVNVQLFSSYEDLRKFIQSLQADNPYVSVAALSIMGRDTDPERHQVAMTLEWPRLQEAFRAQVREWLEKP